MLQAAVCVCESVLHPPSLFAREGGLRRSACVRSQSTAPPHTSPPGAQQVFVELWFHSPHTDDAGTALLCPALAYAKLLWDDVYLLDRWQILLSKQDPPAGDAAAFGAAIIGKAPEARRCGVSAASSPPDFPEKQSELEKSGRWKPLLLREPVSTVKQGGIGLWIVTPILQVRSAVKSDSYGPVGQVVALCNLSLAAVEGLFWSVGGKKSHIFATSQGDFYNMNYPRESHPVRQHLCFCYTPGCPHRAAFA